MNKRSVGTGYENLALDYIRDNGGIILEKNYKNRSGEIDIIAKDEEYICFIEVKYRSNLRFGGPEAAVNIAKQKKICRVSEFYLYYHKLGADIPVRYDVITITGEEGALKVKWIKNAFDHIR